MIISLQDIAKIRNAISNLNLNSPNDFKLYQELSYQFINLNYVHRSPIFQSKQFPSD